MRFAVSVSLALLLAPGPASAAIPHESFRQLPTGNGHSFALYDGDSRRVTLFTEHPYRAYDATTETRNLAYDAYFGVRASAESHWLTDVPLDSVEYVDQSGIVHATQSFGPVRAETYVFSPFGLEAPAVVLALRVTNVSGIVQHDASAYALLNFHLGTGVSRRGAGGAPTPNANGEHVTYDPSHDTFTETGPSGLTLGYVSLGHTTHHGTSPVNPYPVGASGGDLLDTNDSGTLDDAVPGFQWVFPDLAPGASQWVGVLVTLADQDTARRYVMSRTADALVTAERAQWDAWRTSPPMGLSAAETRVWRESEAVLRMAQCRESGRGRGAVVAALPPGIWWISWVRDMAYATVALARSGHMAEAGSAVDFWAGAHVGNYRDRYVNTDYHVSVVRYFGNGEEESDSNENGPNIEFDGFGLSMWAAHAAGRRDMDPNADTLRHLTDTTGLISPDSSIWEVHWNGQQKHYAYTSITAARGLCDAGDATSARALRDAITRGLVLPTGGLAQSLEELQRMQGARDAAVVEAINFGLVDPHGPLAARTIAEFEHLRTPVRRGYFRNDDGGGYDDQEWVFIDLRIADALRRMGRTADADELLAWVTLQTDMNHGLQAELYHRENADYVGSIPMAGFGAGAYMLALLDRAQPTTTDMCFNTTSMALTYDGRSPEETGGCSTTPRRGSGTDLAWVGCTILVALGVSRRKALLPLLATLLAACGNGDSHLLDSGQPDSPITTMDGGDVPITPTSDGGDVPDTSQPPVRGPIPVRSCRTSFVYPLGHGAAHVNVAGEWNHFSTTADPMTDGLGSGTYRAELDLAPGDYGYKFVADGNWVLDPGNPLSRYVDGTENSRIIVPDCHVPDLQVVQTNATPDGTVDITVQYVDGADQRGPDPASFHATLYPGTLPASAIRFDATAGRGTVHLTGLARTKYTFRFDVQDTAHRAARELVIPMWVEQEPYEWGDGPMYFAFTDRFRNGNPLNDSRVGGIDVKADYWGGDWAGVLASLRDGYFDQLGIKVIWLSPANRNTHTTGRGVDGRFYSGYHGYWPNAPREAEPHWGSMDDLRALTAEAHRHGIRVLLDLVQNQLHREHPYFRDHARDGWFNGNGSCVCGSAMCGWDEHMLDCWFTDYLPDVNWTNMAAVDQMIDDAMWWLVEADVDGFRVDAVKHMQHIASTTLRARMRELERGNTRYYTVGETFSGAGDRDLVRAYVSDRELSAQFDFPLFWSVLDAFASNTGTMGDLENAVSASERAYGNAVMSPFLGNHDVERFLSRAAGQLMGDTREEGWSNPPQPPGSDEPYERAMLAFTFLLTQRGIPLIYYGDEIGMPGAADPDNRRPMRFGTDLSSRETRLLDHVRAVGHLRSTHAGLRRGSRRSLYTDGDGYVYARGTSGETAVVALNRGVTSRTVSVRLPADLGVPDGTVLHDALGGPDVTAAGGAIMVPFRPRSSAIYIR